MQVVELLNMTLEEFEAMDKDDWFRYELIDGVVMMSPSPSRGHQIIGAKLIGTLFNQLADTNCQEIYEFEITIEGSRYRPDVMVFCEDEANENLPIIIFEILSPSTQRKDLTIKLTKYEEMGVREYWIIDPKTQTVIMHDFINQTAELYAVGETIQSEARPEIQVELAKIFAQK